MKSKWKIIILIILVILLAVYLYLHFRKSDDFEPQIKQKIAKLVNKATNGLYKIDIGKIQIDITNGGIEAQNIKVYPDSTRLQFLENAKQLSNDIYSTTIKSISIKNLSVIDLIKGKNIDINEITIDGSSIKITHKKRNFNYIDTSNIYEKISSEKQFYNIKKLLFTNANLIIINQDKSNLTTTINNLSANLFDINIDSSSVNDSTRFLFAKRALITVKNYKSETPDKLYKITVDSVSIKPQSDSAIIFGIRLKPNGSKDEFSKKLTYLKDRFDLSIIKMYANKIDWFNLIAGENFQGESMHINDGYIHVYNDRRVPFSPKSKVGNYPHQLLIKLELPIYLPLLVVKKLKVSYEEFNPASEKSGTLELTNVSAQVTNITNIPSLIINNSLMKVTTSSRLMNDGLIQADFIFNLAKAKEGVFGLNIFLNKMDGKNLNKVTENVGMFRVNNLAIDYLKANLEGANNTASANITFAYHDLNIDVLKKAEDGIKKKGFLSFIANAFVLKNTNPSSPNKPLRTYKIEYARIPQKSFFNLIWKTILEGMMMTVKGK